MNFFDKIKYHATHPSCWDKVICGISGRNFTEHSINHVQLSVEMYLFCSLYVANILRICDFLVLICAFVNPSLSKHWNHFWFSFERIKYKLDCLVHWDLILYIGPVLVWTTLIRTIPLANKTLGESCMYKDSYVWPSFPKTTPYSHVESKQNYAKH